MANFFSDVHFMHDDFSELLWDNGPVHTSFANVSQAQEKDTRDSLYPHIAHFRQMEPKVHMFQLSGSSGGFGYHAPNDDDDDPWNYAVDEPLRNAYCPENISDYPDESATALGSLPKSPKDVITLDIPETVCEEDTSRKNNHTRSPDQIQTSSFASSAVLERPETDKGQEAVLASSGSSAEPESNDHIHGEKRMRNGYQSDDVGDASLGLKKPALSRGKNAKRNRAAEVHNLSERRRRDRINEQMRALQELIPNCNKTDKASMLDEATEYLKSLQMQVQIMWMRGGLCVHPMMMMMMRHMRAPNMPQYWPVMGNGWGYMNGFPGCIVPVPPFHHAPGTTALPVFGNHGQRFPVPMAHRETTASASGAATAHQSKSLGNIRKSSAGDSQIQTSTQAQKEECFEELQAKKMIPMK